MAKAKVAKTAPKAKVESLSKEALYHVEIRRLSGFEAPTRKLGFVEVANDNIGMDVVLTAEQAQIVTEDRYLTIEKVKGGKVLTDDAPAVELETPVAEEEAVKVVDVDAETPATTDDAPAE